MFDSLTSSADGLIILLYIIALILFFLYGPHKVYEAIFGSLVGLGFYLFVHEMTFVVPDFTQTLFAGQWMYENRGYLLWIAKALAVALFFVTPLTIGLNVAGVVRGTAWFFIKVFLLSAIYVSFGIVLISMLYATTGVFSEVQILPPAFFQSTYWSTAGIYAWLMDKSYFILFLGFLFGFYKIILSHWFSRIFFLASLAMAKGNAIFGKRSFDAQVGHVDHGGHDDGGHEDHGHDDHGHDDHGHH